MTDRIARKTFLCLVLSAALGCGENVLRPPFASGFEGKKREPNIVDKPLVESSLPEGRSPGALRVATVFPTLGRYAISGRQSHNGARLAVERINEHGGIHGRQIELLAYRTGSYFVDSRYAAEAIVERDEVLALVGANSSGLSKVIAEIAEGHGLVQVSNVSTAPDLTWDPDTGENYEHIFRVCHSDAVMGELLAGFARTELEARRVAVLFEVGRPYSAKLAESFVTHFADERSGFSRRAGYAVEEFSYKRRETDFRSHLEAVADFAPDVIFVPGSFSDATLIAMQLEKSDIEATMLGGDSWSNRLLFARGGPSRVSFHSDHWHPAGWFKDDYEARFEEELNGARAALAYDAVFAISRALESLGPLDDEDLQPRGSRISQTRARLRNALVGVDFKGVTGRIRFDGNGDAIKGCAIIEVRPRDGGQGYTSLESVWLGEK